MILVCTPNPSLDRTTVVARFAVGQIFRVGSTLELAGGKGFNVARVLHALGEDVLVVGPLGGRVGEAVLEQAGRDGLSVDPVSIAGQTRTCLSIVDRDSRQVTELYEEGPALEHSEWGRVADMIDRHLAGATLLLVCGSFPGGVADDALGDLVEAAGRYGVPAWVDCRGTQLARALARKPGLVKLNREEAEEVTGLAVVDVDDALAAAEAIRSRGAGAAVVTLGRDGAAGVDERGASFAWCPPAVDVLSAVGSGDALFAGMAAGAVGGKALAEATRTGVALGTANTLRIGAGLLNVTAAEALLPRDARLA